MFEIILYSQLSFRSVLQSIALVRQQVAAVLQVCCLKCIIIIYVHFKVATDALVSMEKAMKRDNIEVNDRQLACARIQSKEGQDYLNGMILP